MLAGVLAGLAFVSFLSAMPLWLVREAGLPSDSAVVGWTLAAIMPLVAVLHLPVGGAAYFVACAAAGALQYASFPL